jgi:hypothetical protein
VSKRAATQKEPTFATCSALYWDDEHDRPDEPTPADLCDDGVVDAVNDYLAAYADWLAISEREDEAEARRAYAEKAARHLVGVFPNARVSEGAYAAALGEDLGGHTADIVKAIALRARRTCKTLPPVATLVEWAEEEAQKRHRQARAYRDALAGFERQKACGVEIARRLSGYLSGAVPSGTPEAVASLWRQLTLLEIGISAPDYSRAWRAASSIRLLCENVQAGHAEAVEAARTVFDELDMHDRRMAELSAALATDESVEGAWHEAWGAQHLAVGEWRERIESAVQKVSDKTNGTSRPAIAMPISGLTIGVRVRHEKFGQGAVVAVDGDRVDVAFDRAGAKRVLARFLAAATDQTTGASYAFR